MSLVVEDGTAKATAESFISVADAETRLSNRGDTTWTAAATADKESALRQATDYMEQAYRSRWKGERVTLTQALSWPRYGAYADEWLLPADEVPAVVANACADLALKVLGGTSLNADLTQNIIREKVGPLETEYDPNSSQAIRFRAVDMALGPFLKGSSAMASLVRA